MSLPQVNAQAEFPPNGDFSRHADRRVGIPTEAVGMRERMRTELPVRSAPRSS
jgi:hypothetical protein